MTGINYITNLDVNEESGGWLGMNHHVYNQLASKFDVNLIQKIDPPYSVADRYLSKVLRVAGLRGSVAGLEPT